MSTKPKRVDFGHVWSELKSVCENLLTLTEVDAQRWQKSFENIYLLFKAYPEPCAEALYKELKAFLDQYTKGLCKETQKSEDLLMAYKTIFSTYSNGVKDLNSLFRYFNDRFVIYQNSRYRRYSDVQVTMYMEVGELGMDYWKKNVTECLEEQLLQVILDRIESDRRGVIPNDEALVQDVIHSLIKMEQYKGTGFHYYQTAFEDRFLKETYKYYRNLSCQLIKENDCVAFMEKVLKLNEEENFRCERYIHTSSYPIITRAFRRTMVEENLEYLYKECKIMVQEECQHGLKLMYRVLKLVSLSLTPVVEELRNHIVNKGEEFIKNIIGGLNPQVFVENIGKFIKKYINFVQETFDSDVQLVKASDKAIAKVVNSRENPELAGKQSELLAKYFDTFLRSQPKITLETDVEDKLAHAVKIFRYIRDKDLFLKLYSQMLGKRLIFGTSMSLDSEGFMITKLKETCGFAYVESLSQMFADIQLNIGLNEKLSNYIEENKIDLGYQLNVAILQNGSWPMSNTSHPRFAVPLTFERSIRKFETFYFGQFYGRKLTWLHHMSYADIKLCYVKRPCTVTMNSYQTAILLLFEQVDSMTFNEIKDNTGLEDVHLRKNIEALTHCSLLLVKEDSGDKFVAGTLFTLNLKHESKRRKYKVAFVPSKVKEEADGPQRVTGVNWKETPTQSIQASNEGTQRNHAQVAADRKILTEAAIVWIMKSLKRARLNVLVEKVITQVKNQFVPDVPQIKKCIESLIEKDYIELIPESSDEYNYAARYM